MAAFIPISLFMAFVALYGADGETGLMNRLTMTATILQVIPLLFAPLFFPTHKCVNITEDLFTASDTFFGLVSFSAVIGYGSLTKREVRSFTLYRAGELLNDVAVMRVTPKFGTSTDVVIAPENLADNLCEFGYEVSLSNWAPSKPAPVSV